MKISDERMPQPDAKNAVGFAHLVSAQGVAPRSPFEIALANDKLGATAWVEGRRFANLPTCVLAFSEDCSDRGGAATDSMAHLWPTFLASALHTVSVTTVKAPIESCTA